ncbi:hypothetical protein GCK32_004637 [Trichostrongylus colubriformis]|uniref:Uncharacterized protein n=1 Tax=Trichostrongylus colubriformis TaxID=6319 RepID=A0AAN8IES2_TRICO
MLETINCDAAARRINTVQAFRPMRRGGGPIHHGAPIPTTLGLAFPACVTEALIQVSKHVRLSTHGRSRPVLTKNNDLQLLIDNEIFCLSADRKGSRLSQLQEFTLINHLAHFFAERDEMNKYAYFEVLFLGREGESHVHEHRLRILYRLASYALQFPILQLYAQISLWLSKVGNSKPYAEELVAVLAEHYLKPNDSQIYEYLLPLETSCPEFTVFFVVYATRLLPINRPMAAVFASYINRNPGYFLKGFRDSPHLADIFRTEVFEKMLAYLLDLDGEPSGDREAMNFHTAVMVLLDKWNTTIKKPLDIGMLFDPKVRWSRFRCDALCIIGSKSSAACRMVISVQIGRMQSSANVCFSDIRRTSKDTGFIRDPVISIPSHTMISRLSSLNVGRCFVRVHSLRLLRTSVVAAASHHGEKGDLFSFVGAGVGVLLTVLAVAFYTDLFGTNIKSKANGPGAHAHEEGVEERHPIQEKKAEKSEPAAKTSQEQPEQPKEPEGETQPSESQSKAFSKPTATTMDSETPPPTTKRQGKAHDDGKKQDPPPMHGKKEHDEAPSDESKRSEADAGKGSSSEEGASSPVNSKEEKKKIGSSAGEEVPKSVEYLLIGAGAASYYASLAIRARHADAKVLMIGEEDHLPYNRPPLSKELWWYGDENASSSMQYEGLSGKKRDVYFEAEGFFVPPGELPSTVHGGVSLLRGHRVEKLNPDEKKAYLDDGTCISYEKCLIATGGKPKDLPELKNASDDVKKRILYLRGVDDYRTLDSICKSAKSILIVGGGFIGSELAYSIHRKYKDIKISQVVAENGNLSHVLPEFLSKKATESLRGIGVDVITGAKITAARKRGEQVEVEVNNGSKSITSDYIIVCIGIQPDTSVAEASGLELSTIQLDNRLGGVTTDAELRVRSDIWAAGDAASFYDKSLGRRRVEHWENAQVSGRLAGENMTGAGKAFWYQPAFFSKIAPQWHINAVGITDSSLPTVSVFAKDDNANESFERGVVFYKGDDGKVVGVLLLNVYGSGVDVSRRLIEEARSIDDFQQLAKLYQLYRPAEPEDEEKNEEKKAE